MASVRKLKSGKWQARVTVDGKQVSAGTYKTKKEATIAANKAEEKKYFGQTLGDRHLTFGEVAEIWLNQHKTNYIKASSYEKYDRNIKKHVLPFFSHKKIMNIKRSDIASWINTYANKTNSDGSKMYSFNTLESFLILIKSIFRFAVLELEVLEKNPADRLKTPTAMQKAEEERKFYTLEELNKLLRYVATYQTPRYGEYKLYYMLMLFLSKSGLRISEALALTWDDIDGDALTVNKQIRRDDKRTLYVETLKNKASYRQIKLDHDIVKELKKFKFIQKECIMRYAGFKKNDDNIIFRHRTGQYLDVHFVRDKFKRLCAAAKVDYKGTHVFRHTHAVLLLESGAPLIYVSKRLGHSTIKTTADTYLSITEKMNDDELQKFADYTKINFK